MAILKTYSFMDVEASIDGIRGAFSLVSGASDDGITVQMTGDKNTMVTGAGRGGMHTLHASSSGTVTVHLLKTSPVNGLLLVMYDAQTNYSPWHGQNVIIINNPKTGERVTCEGVAFSKLPDSTNSKDVKSVDWVFHALEIQQFFAKA